MIHDADGILNTAVIAGYRRGVPTAQVEPNSLAQQFTASAMFFLRRSIDLSQKIIGK